MSKLISAEFERLFKNKIFCIALVLCAIVPILITIITISYQTSIVKPFFYPESPETSSFVYVGIISAVFISLFIGRDFSDGTIRNKLIIGHSRTAVYISEFVVCLVAEIIMQLLYIIVLTLSFLVFCGGFKASFEMNMLAFMNRMNPIQFILKTQLILFFIIIAYTSIFLLVSILCSKKSKAITASILLAFVLLVFGKSVYQTVLPEDTLYEIDMRVSDTLSVEYEEIFGIFNQPLTPPENYLVESDSDFSEDLPNEFDDEISDDFPDDVVFVDMKPVMESYTKYYGKYIEEERGGSLKGIKRIFYLLLNDILPSCQAEDIIQCSLSDLVPLRAVRYVICDCIIAVAFTALGLFLFNRKDIK